MSIVEGSQVINKFFVVVRRSRRRLSYSSLLWPSCACTTTRTTVYVLRMYVCMYAQPRVVVLLLDYKPDE